MTRSAHIAARAIATDWRCPPDREETEARAERSRTPKALELFARLTPHRCAVDEAKSAEQARQDNLPAEKQIFVRGQIGGEREILINRRNAMSLRVVGGIEGDRFAGQKDLPLVRPVGAGQDLHQR